MKNGSISCNTDCQSVGVHHGHLELPHSYDCSALNTTMTLLNVSKNTKSSAVTIKAANHCNEDERLVALSRDDFSVIA